MSSSTIVPVIDVQSNNFKELWPALVVAIQTSSFIALDTELSGLGNRKALLAESIEDRYKAICHAARSRSIISLGLGCYKKLDHKPPDSYLVQVYNLTLLCSEEYIIEPQSVQFLVQHGFDFNKQYSSGIPYCKGNNKGGADDRGVNIRALFTELLRARKPLVLHNGLIDMVFLYQSFYAHLPERLATFTADLSEMFPAGIYDTKYVTEFELRLTASYLEYAYKKCKLENSRSVTSASPGPHIHVEFCQYAGHLSTYIDYRECPAVAFLEGQTDICQRFSAFGWCPNGNKCPLSHDTDLIILQDEKCKEEKRKKRKRKREKKGGSDTAEDCSAVDGAPQKKMPNMDVDKEEAADDQQEAHEKSGSESVPQMETDGNHHQIDEGQKMKSDNGENGESEEKTDAADSATTSKSGERSSEEGAGVHPAESNAQAKKKADAGSHRAGFDAYMTGYIFAYSCALIKKEEAGVERVEEESKESWLPTCINKIYLSGKAAPLNVVKSTFSKSSKAHIQKMEMVWAGKM
ncbi:target of EGR1 protein 1 [Fundulus heteroclitus]|uniref:target of EGR1 protein 1 n=1 Tax=Fundulus heteroclitus TaxID=8078 RepID=UPI00165C85D8|nr:target of EGR1 protein 1 [Fundulus heteroclitus]